MSADQITAEDKEEIDTNPAPTMHASGHGETHDAGVINDDNDDRECAKKIEPRLALAIGKSRINFEPKWRCCDACLRTSLVNARTLNMRIHMSIFDVLQVGAHIPFTSVCADFVRLP